MIYDAVVEDINDPMKIGRVRVRVFGKHTDNTSLIPTASLPWSQVLMPVSSASMSGKGDSPGGLLPGSWVKIVFIDIEEQYPLVLGSIHGIQEDASKQKVSIDEIEFTDSENTSGAGNNNLTDSTGKPVTDSSGEPIKTGTEVPVVPGKVDPSKLGTISERYESGGRGPGVINNYRSPNFGDRGGASYGVYQLASYLISESTPANGSTKKDAAGSTLKEYIESSKYNSSFTGLTPATDAFDVKWKELASTDSIGFRTDQHKFIERTHYQFVLNKLPSNIRNRGVAVHEAIWSRAVHTKGLAVALFKDSIGGIDDTVCDSKAVELLMDLATDRIDANFSKSDAATKQSIRNRFKDEKAKLISLAKSYEGECVGKVVTKEVDKIEYTEEGKVVTKEVKISEVKETTAKRGFQDPSGKYPLYHNESDTNRLARGIITGTITEKKKRSVITGKGTGQGSISEPTTQFNAKYPWNKVHETASGHVIEIDDTPGYERIAIHHTSGSFVEFYPDGKVVKKTYGSDHEVIIDNKEVIINGDCIRVVGGDSVEKVSGDMRLTINGDLNIQVNGDYTINTTGTFKVNASNIQLN